MGQTLSEPVTEKHSTSGADDRMAFGVSEMQGWRLSMEDAHTHVLDLDAAPAGESHPSENSTAVKDRRSYFAVYDGHGGSAVARFAGDTVFSRLRATQEYKSKDYPAALKRTFLATDDDLRSNPDFKGDPSGCTAVATLITEDRKIICANAGDSRSILSVGGVAEPMSHDHKPVNKLENARIVAAGGFVEFGRVNGNLALSRALGDFEFKQNAGLSAENQVVTADPDIIIHDATDEDEFLILACDGIWDVLQSQQCVDFIRRTIVTGRPPLDKVCEEVIDRCLAPDSDWGGVGCDNMTIMVVALLNGRTLDQWYDWMATRVASNVGHATPQLDDIPNQFRQGHPNRGPGGGIPLSFTGQQMNAPPSNAMGSSLAKMGMSSGTHDDEDDDDDLDSETMLSHLQAALRREGIQIGSASNEEMELDQEDKAPIDHPAVEAEGLSDKSEDVLASAASA